MFATVNNTRLYYHTHGQGRPLLLMHGGLGLDHTGFVPFLHALGEDAELIFYDHRGNGRSDRPDSFDGITHETWIDDADLLRAELGHDRIILLGHSYGGFLAQDYALKYGDRLDGLILVDTAPVLDYMPVIQGNAAARGTTEQLEALNQVFGRPMAGDADFQAMWNAITPLYFHKFDPAVAAAMDAATQYSGAAWNHVNAHCLPVFNTLDRLGEITTPTLIISGADDWITPPEHGGKRLHTGIPNSTFVVMEHSGHWPFIEENDLFIATVRNWLKTLN